MKYGEYAAFEWIFKQLTDHPFMQIFEPCFKMVIAYERNLSIAIIDGHLVSEDMSFSNANNFQDLKMMFNFNNYNYKTTVRMEPDMEGMVVTAVNRIALLYVSDQN